MDLKGWITTLPGIEGSGYIASVNDSAHLSTTLLWHGPENAIQRAIVAEGQRRGITVTIRQRKFSSAQLMAAAQSACAERGHGHILRLQNELCFHPQSGLRWRHHLR